MEEGVGVGDAIPLVIHHPIGSTALLHVRVGPVLDERRLIAGQSQLVHLRICGVTDTNRQRAGAGQSRQGRVCC